MRYSFVNLYIGKRMKKLNSYQRVWNTGKVTYTEYAEIQSPCLITFLCHFAGEHLNLIFLMTRYLALTLKKNAFQPCALRYKSVMCIEVLCFFMIKIVYGYVCVCVCGPVVDFSWKSTTWKMHTFQIYI